MSQAAPAASAAPAAAPAAAPSAAPAAPAAPAGGGIAQGSSAAPAALHAVSDWHGSFTDEHRGFVQNKGWKDGNEVVNSYRNLEKLVGAPADQVIKLPAADDVQGWDSVHSRLGRPATPEGYKFGTPKEGQNADFTKWAANEFHKNGLTEKQGKAIAESWNQQFVQAADSQKAAYAERVTTETASLKKEWGAAYDQNINVAKRAAREFGVEPKVIDAIESSAGLAATMKLFNSIGAKMGDANYVSGNAAGGRSDGPMTPQQAQDQIKVLRGDTDFVKKYIAGDAQSKMKMEMLHKYAHPDG